jgi:hypothetical protein
MFKNFINVTLLSCLILLFLALRDYLGNSSFLPELLKFICLKCIFFYFLYFFEAGSYIFTFPFFLIFSLFLFDSISFPELVYTQSLLRNLPKTLSAPCPDLLLKSDETDYVFSYAFPLDSPKMMPVAIR